MGDRRRSFEFRLLAQADKVRMLLALLLSLLAYAARPGTVANVGTARATAIVALGYALLSHFVLDWHRVRREGGVHLMSALLACFDVALINIFVLGMGPEYRTLLTIMISDIVFVAAFFSGLELAFITLIACVCLILQEPSLNDAGALLSLLGQMASVVIVAWLAYAVTAVGRDERVISDRVLRHLTEGVMLVSRHGRLSVVNPRLEQMTGVNASAVMGLDIYAPESQAHLAPLADLLAGVTSAAENLRTITSRALHIEDPSPLDIQCITVPCVSESGRALAWVIVCKDVTEVMSEVRQKEESLEIVSHELRGRVHGVRASVEVLAGMAGTLTPGMRDAALRLLDSETTRITDLIGRIVDASAVQNGTVTMELEPVDVATLVRQVRDCLAPLATSKRISLEVVSDRSCPGVLADVTRLDQVVHNLVENAIKFTPPGGCVRTEVTTADGAVQVSVTDTGCGIPAHELARIFEKFVHGAEARGDPVGAGLGLGLHICREIVARHGGRLEVHSVEGEGSTFTFAIPLVPPDGLAGSAIKLPAPQREFLVTEGVPS